MKFKNPIYRLACTFALALISVTGLAHNEHPLGRQPIEWQGGQQILRTIALNFDFHGGDNFITYRPHGRVERHGDRDCLVGPYFLFDIDDRFAYDIDETVTLELVFDTRVSEGFNLSYDHAVKPQALTREFSTGSSSRFVTHRVDLPRARFANRKYQHTDLAIGAPNSRFPPGDYQSGHMVALCGIKVLRNSRGRPPLASGRLHLEVTDADDQPTTVRLGLYDADGKSPLADRSALPVQRFSETIREHALRFVPASWPSAGRYVYYINGQYGGAVEAGTYTLVINKGPEYRQVVREITVAANETSTLAVQLERWRDLPAEGWYSGDDHVHIRRLDPAADSDILAYAQAEDVHLTNLLQMGNVSGWHFPQYAFGKAGHRYQGDYVILAGQESPRTSHRGHTIGLNGKRFHWPGHDYFLYDKTADAIHADGGLFGYAHVALDAFHVAWGLALDVPLGYIDFVEMLQMNTLNTGYLYDFLNMGFRLLPSAGSDYPYIHVAGTERIYAHIDGEFSVANWFKSWQKRRSFVSNGPIIEFTVNGDSVTNEYEVHRGEQIRIKARAAVNPDYDQLDRLELVALGQVIASSGKLDGDSITLEHEFEAATSMWLALRSYGASVGKAHTAPIYIYVNGDRRTHDRETVGPTASRYAALLHGLKDSRPTLDEEWERFNVEADVLRKWDDDKPDLDRRIERALEIYDVLIQESTGTIERL